jgi:hypothetical protein
MRVALTVIVFMSPLAGWANGGVCVIHDLFPGLPIEVSVENIDKDFCGAARINRRIVRLDQKPVRKYDGPVSCDTSGEHCWKRVEYFLSADDSMPYVVILKGPRLSAAAAASVAQS